MNSKYIKSSILVLVMAFLIACSNDDPQGDPPEYEVTATGVFLDDFTYGVFARATDNFDIAEFRLWYPENVSEVRAILVLSDSYNSNAMGYTSSKIWRDFATSENLAILGVHYRNITDTAYYAWAEDESGRALLEALARIANKQGHDFLIDLPFVLRGYSAGGVFSHSFAGFLPNRVIGFANIRGGSISETPADSKNVPGLFFYGELDNETRNQRINQAFLDVRNEGGRWALIKEAQVDHFGGTTEADELIRSFFSACLKERMQEGTNELKELTEESGWLGSNFTFDINSFQDYPNEKYRASWLVNQDFAEQWSEFQKKPTP